MAAPAPSRKGYASGRLGQVHYFEIGAGPALVLLGPTPRSYRGLRRLAEALAPDFRCLVVDQLGYGESAGFPDRGRIEDVAEAVGYVLDGLRIESADVFGLLSGLKVGTALAAERGAQVRRLILCGKSHSIAPEMDLRNRATRRVVDPLYFSGGAGPSAGDMPLRDWAARWRQLSQLWWSDSLLAAEDPAQVAALIEEKIADEMLAHRHLLPSYEANFAFDLEASLRRVAAEVLVIEVTSAIEDRRIGRQGAALCACARSGSHLALAETDPTGLELYVGVARLAAAIRGQAQAG